MSARGVLAVTILALLAPPPASAKDITQQVLQDTTLGKQLTDACRAYCLGNRARATLNSVHVVRLGPDTFAVTGRASLRNQQFVEPTVLFGAQVGGFDLFNYTVVVDGNGTLDARTCDLRIDALRVIDDRLNLTDVARREVGKIHRVPDCRKFLDGL